MGGVEGENLEDIFENHDERRWGDGVGAGAFRSTELLRLRPPDFGMGMGFVCEAPLVSVDSTGPWVLVEFERCRVCDRAGVAVASEVAVVVVAGGGEPMGWRA